MKVDDKATGSAAQELEKAINDTYHLVAESLVTLNAKASSLIRDIKSGRVTKAEIEVRQAEINDLGSRVEQVKILAQNAEKKLEEYNKKSSERQ